MPWAERFEISDQQRAASFMNGGGGGASVGGGGGGGVVESSAGTKGWFVTRLQASVLTACVILSLILAIFVGRMTVSDCQCGFQTGDNGTETAAEVEEIREAEEMRYLVEPSKYRIYLQPFLEKPPTGHDKFTFMGNVTITLKSKRQLRNLQLSATDLKIISTQLTRTEDNDNNKKNKDILVTINSYDQREGILHLRSYESLKPGVDYELSISFVGDIQKAPYGIYRIPDAVENEWLVAANLEAPYARTVFPCFDAPDQKAAYELIVGRRQETVCESSTFFAKSTHEKTDWMWDEFEASPSMPLDRLSFVVSRFHPEITASPAIQRFSLWTRNNNTDVKNAAYALDMGVQLIDAYGTWLQTLNPLRKVELFALPNDVRGFNYNGKMSIALMSKSRLLGNESSPTSTKKVVASSLSGIIGQQWVESSINFHSENDEWIKRGLAGYLQHVVLDSIRPQWEIMKDFQLRQSELLEGQLFYEEPTVVEFPTEDKSFIFPLKETDIFTTDSIWKHKFFFNETKTEKILRQPGLYSEVFGEKETVHLKGMCLFRMLHHVVTDDIFKTSLKTFLENSKDKWVTPEDFWDVLNSNVLNATVENHELLPDEATLHEVWQNWAKSTEIPTLTVTRDYKHSNVKFVQSLKHSEENEDLWYLPISYTIGTENNFEDTTPKIWLKKVIALDTDFLKLNSTDYILVNPRQTGLYRVNYDEGNWKLLAKNLRNFPVAIRQQLVDDALFFAKRGETPYEWIISDMLENLSRTNETDWAIWRSIFHHFRYVETMLDSTEIGLLRTLQRDLYTPVYNKITENGKDAAVIDHYPDFYTWACESGVENCDDAKEELEEWKANRPTKRFEDMPYEILCQALRRKNDTDWDYVARKYEKSSATDAKSKDIYLKSLYCSEADETKLKKLLSKTLSSNTSLELFEEITKIWKALKTHPVKSEVPFEYFVANFVKIKERFAEFQPIWNAIVEGATANLKTDDHLNKLSKLQSAPNFKGYANISVKNAVANLKEKINWSKNVKGTFILSLSKRRSQNIQNKITSMDKDTKSNDKKDEAKVTKTVATLAPNKNQKLK